MFIKKAFSAITSKLPKLLKTLTSKLPSTISSIAGSSGFSQALNFLKSNSYVPQKIKNIANVVSNPQFTKKIQNIGTNAIGMAGTAALASSILGPQAGLAIEAIGLGKDAYDIYRGYQEVDAKIRQQQRMRRNRLMIPKITSVNPQNGRSYQDYKTKIIDKQREYPKIKKRLINGYTKRKLV